MAIKREVNIWPGSWKGGDCLNRRVQFSMPKLKDYSGSLIGRLKVLHRIGNVGRRVAFLCQCTCPRKRRVIRISASLSRAHKNGLSPNCGCVRSERAENFKGRIYGRLRVVGCSRPRICGDGSPEIRWKCMCDCGRTKIVSGGALKSGHTRSCGCLGAPDLSGHTFGRLEVLGPASTWKNQRRWKCRCSCKQRTIVVRTTTQLRGKRKSSRHCRCIRRERMTEYFALHRNPATIAQSLVFRQFQQGAKRRGIPFHLTREAVCELIRQKCFYCGSPPSQRKQPYFNPGRHHKLVYIGDALLYSSIDRVDSRRGYEPDNLVPCCRICQNAKGMLPVQEWIGWIERVHSRIGDIRALSHDQHSGTNSATLVTAKGV
jgi:hypothetical protein